MSLAKWIMQAGERLKPMAARAVSGIGKAGEVLKEHAPKSLHEAEPHMLAALLGIDAYGAMHNDQNMPPHDEEDEKIKKGYVK